MAPPTPRPKGGGDASLDPSAVFPAGTLARHLDRAPGDWTVDHLVAAFVSLRLRVVSLLHVGGDGALKTLDFAPSDVGHLTDILSVGERADGSSLFGAMGVPVTASDVVLRPRLATAFVDPLATEPTLAILCGHHGRDGRPLPESPDTLVRRAHQRLVETAGVDLHALGEVEFFLGRRPEEEEVYASADRGYHAAAPFVFGEALRRRALVLLADMGVPVKYGHSEVGHIEADGDDGWVWEQHEIEMGLQPLPAAADGVVLAQWVLRNLARRSGVVCSFDPVLREGHAGSGMHFHLSPVVDGAHHPVVREGDALHDPARWLIGGLVGCADGLMAFGNRAPSSFVRLTQAKEAPSAITWGRHNRKALIRLPITPTDASGTPVGPETVEFRLPDGSAHPHLLLAGVAQAMVAGRATAGLDALIEATSARTPSPERAASVPRSFGEVAAALRAGRGLLEAGGVFPSHVVDRVLQTLEGA